MRTFLIYLILIVLSFIMLGMADMIIGIQRVAESLETIAKASQ